jgi:two-component system, chemotaxis family, response regulator Rcp1
MKTILIVEDNPADARLIEEAFRETPTPTMLFFVHDGLEALAFLRQEGEYPAAPRPDMIFLDLNIPKVDGRTVIRTIQADEELRRIPVVVLSGSTDELENVGLASEGIKHFLVKPADLDAYIIQVSAHMKILG